MSQKIVGGIADRRRHADSRQHSQHHCRFKTQDQKQRMGQARNPPGVDLDDGLFPCLEDGIGIREGA